MNSDLNYVKITTRIFPGIHSQFLRIVYLLLIVKYDESKWYFIEYAWVVSNFVSIVTRPFDYKYSNEHQNSVGHLNFER